MNREVTVSGMQITAKSDSVYLLISSSKTTAAEIQTEGVITAVATVDENAAKVFPSAHESITNNATAGTETNWYYQVANAPTASASTSEKVILSGENFDQYVIKRTVYVVLAAGSNSATNLKVTSAEITSNSTATGEATTLTPVKVVVASSTACVELDSTTTSSTTPLAATVTNDTVIALDIFIYYNGADNSVYTNNIANLEGANIKLTFAVDAAA